MAQKNRSLQDRERSKFIESPSRSEESAVEVSVGNSSSSPVQTEIVGLELSDCGDAQVNDGACDYAASIEKTITGEEIAAIGAVRITGGKSILIQPVDKDIYIGHTAGQAIHLITKGNFYEFQGKDTIHTYIKPKAGATIVAISEFK